MGRQSINISNTHRSVLYKEFPVNRVTINNALNYRHESDLARNIRKRAKQLLKEEVIRVEAYED